MPGTSADHLASPPPSRRLATINGGSSSIKFAVYTADDPPRRQAGGVIERIGSPQAVFRISGADGRSTERVIGGADHRQAATELADWLATEGGQTPIVGIGHRVVFGSAKLVEHQRVTDELVGELRKLQPLDLAHLPRELALIEVFRGRFPGVGQVACFDTAFHANLPQVAKILPIPRRYAEMGVQRLGFHGLSYTYLMEQLGRLSPREAQGRVILAHLGSGASMAAVRGGQPIDTTMAFTPTSGLVMGTRPGDLDPGLLLYLMSVEKKSGAEMDEFISQRCGMLGVSETSSDMRDLLARRQSDARAADAVDLFCYQARKFVGAFAAALGGLDSLVFAGGIGEHSPEARAGICQGLEFLGLRLDPARNAAGAAVISADGSAVVARVIPTDEESMIAQIIVRVLGLELGKNMSAEWPPPRLSPGVPGEG